MESAPQPTNDIQLIRGHPFPVSKWITRKNIEDSLDYAPHDGDIVIASYPKTGSTWLQCIVLQIVTKAQQYPSFEDILRHAAPLMEMAGVSAVDEMKDPRIYKHHIPYSLMKKNEKCKYLYIYRNPEDTAVSFYYFMLELGEFNVTFDTFFENFVTGNVGNGLYFDHLMSYYSHKNDENMLLISYEKLHANTKEEILKIAKFLGEGYYQCLVENESILDLIMEHISFDYMKENLYMNDLPSRKEGKDEEVSGKSERKIKFFRKGIVGDGKNLLTEDKRLRLKAVAEEKLKDTEIIKEWYMK